MATLEQRAQAPQQTNPETENVSAVPSAEKSKLGKYGLASGALLGLGGIITGAVIGLSSDKEAPRSQETGSQPVAAGEAIPGQVGERELPPLDMYNTDITHEDYGRQLDVILPYLEERREQSLREVADELNAENRVPLPDPNQYPEGSDMRRAVEDQLKITADLWTISGEQNTTLARNLLNGVFLDNPDSSTDAHDLTENLIGNGKGRIKEYTNVYEVSPPITQGTLGTTKIEGPESYVALLGSWTTGGKAYEQVISKRVSQDGKHSNDVVIESIQWGDRGFVEHPAQITPGS